MNALKNFNLMMKFLLELAMLAAFGYWGFSRNVELPIRITVGVGAPMLAAVVWGLFMAPNAKWRLRGLAFHAVEIVLFGLAAAALSAQWGIALVFLSVYVVNKILLLIWKQ